MTFDFLTCLSCGICAWLAVFACAAFSRRGRTGRREKEDLDPRHVWVCSVCTYNYVNTREEAISSCPRCGSLNKR